MASTRNKNTPGNYCLQLRQDRAIENWELYKHGANGEAYDTRLPGNGLNPAQLPGSLLSYNSTDIESFLFGINATNLVNPAPPLTPELKCLKTANLFKTPAVIMPIPQAIPKYQRPFPIP
jgi:hypothetical protein